MTPREAALQALLAVFVAGGGDDKPIPGCKRNRDVARVWDYVLADGSSVRSALTLRDGTAEFEEVLGYDDPFNVTRRAALEWVVAHSDDTKRDAAFDAGIAEIARLLAAENPAGGAVAVLDLATTPARHATARISDAQDSDLVFDGFPQVKATILIVELTYLSPLPM